MRSSSKEWDERSHRISVYDAAGMAKVLTDEQPLFRARSGGVYAVSTHKVKDKEMPASFIRVDKPKMPHKIRKKMKRQAKQLAIEAEFKH